MTLTLNDIASSLASLGYFIAAFAVIYYLAPSFVVGPQPDMDRTERFWAALTVGFAYWIGLCLLLSAFGFHDLVGLVGATTGLAILYAVYVRHQNVRKAGEQALNYSYSRFMDLVDQSQYLYRHFNRRESFHLPARPRWGALFAGWDYPRLIIWAVFLYAAYLRMYDPVTHYSFSFFDPYVHIVWLKKFNQGDIFYDGIYPRGYHAFLSVLGTFSGLEPATLIRFAGAVIGALIPPALYFFLRQCRVPWTGALVGTSITSVCSLFGAQIERQTAALPQEFSMLLTLLALAFAVRYLRSGVVRDRWIFFLASFVVWMVHSLTGLALLLGLVALAIDYIFHKGVNWNHFLLVARETILAALVGNLFQIEGLIWGHRFYAASFDVLVHSSTAKNLAPMDALREAATIDPQFRTLIPLTFAAVIVTTFGLTRRREDIPSPAFVGLWALMLFAFWAVQTGWNVNLLLPAIRAQYILVLAVCGVGAWLYTLMIEPVLGKRDSNSFIRVAAACATIGALIAVFYTPPVSPLHPQYEEAARIYYRLVARLDPGSWTLVGQSEEYELALSRGNHMTVPQFISNYPPYRNPVFFPTPYMFIVVEKRPKPMPANLQSAGREADEKALQDWIQVYAVSHKNLSLVQETPDVAVYMIKQSEVGMRRLPPGPLD